MPLIKLQTSVKCAAETKEELALELSKICAKGIGKPESCVASIIEDDAVISFGGKIANTAFVEIKSIGGLNSDVNNRLSAMICDALNNILGIPGSRVYINFSDISANNWGCDGQTFG